MYTCVDIIGQVWKKKDVVKVYSLLTAKKKIYSFSEIFERKNK